MLLSPSTLALLERFGERHTFPGGTTILREGETTRELYYVLAGEGVLTRNQLQVQRVHPGDHVGELGLLAGTPRAATWIAESATIALRLDRDGFARMCELDPRGAIALVQELVSSLGARLTAITDDVGAMLRERSLPRRLEVTIELNGQRRSVRTGTRVGELLQDSVAALVDRNAVSLSTPIVAPGRVEGLSREHWEGQRIVRESANLLMLEAAARVGLRARIAATMGTATWIDLEGEDAVDRLRSGVTRLISEAAPFREELWTLEEARAHFNEVGATEAVDLLATWRDATVPLVSCGRSYAIRMGAMVEDARALADIEVEPARGGALLICGKRPPGISSRTAWADTMRDHDRWLAGLGVTSVGAFNRSCIDGRVSETIRIAEGFHEKRLSSIADTIAVRSGVRVITIAGPSSSGKTTFIRRLDVQLRIVGTDPVYISLDDYYVDRERTIRGPDGEYDFEALEALDIPLLCDHVRRLLAGERVKTPRYDFVSGKSIREGGREVQLGGNRVLMLEGIHGLNPRLLGDVVPHAQMFRIFIQPMAALPLDHASRASASDLRLLRRIVRDRRSRGATPGDNIMRWPSVRRGERFHIFPFVDQADIVFDTSLVYEPSVLKTYAERYLLEVPVTHPAHATASRLRRMIDHFVAIHAAHVPPTSILREFIGESGFEY